LVLLLLAALAPACTLHHRYEALRIGYAMRPRHNALDMQLVHYEVGPQGPRPQTVTVGSSLRFLSHTDRGGLEGALHLRLHAFRLHSDDDAWGFTNTPYRAGDPHLRRVRRRGRWATQQYLGRAHIERFSTGMGLDLLGGGYGPWITTRRPDGRLRSSIDMEGFVPGVAVTAFARALVGRWFTFTAEAGYLHADGVGGPFLRVGAGMALDQTITPGLPRLYADDP